MSDECHYGRIKENRRKDGYGFIYSEDGNDIFYSSYNFKTKRSEKNACVGATVKYKLTTHEERLCATEIEVIEKYPEGNIITLPNGKVLNLHCIRKFGLVSGKNALNIIGVTEEEAKSHGHELSEFDFLFFSTEYDEFRFFRTGSCVQGDGQCDINAAYSEYQKRLLSLI